MFTFTKASRQPQYGGVMYRADGLRGSLRISRSYFQDEDGPASFTLDPESGAVAGLIETFAVKRPMTAEERKAARKAAPKPTLEQRIAKKQRELARLQAAAEKAAEQPVGV